MGELATLVSGCSKPVRGRAAMSIEPYQRWTVFVDAARTKDAAVQKLFASVGEHPKCKHKGEHNSLSTDRRTRKVHPDVVAIELPRTLDLHNA
jgi:hypothetical protein